MNKADEIRTLKKIEIEVLFWLCMGKSNAEIAETIEKDVKTVESRLKSIYAKLNIPGEGIERRNNLLAEYCKTVKEIVRSESDIRTWIPQRPPPEEQGRYEIIETENPEPEDTSPPPPVAPEPQGRIIRLVTQEQMTRTMLYAGGIIVVLILIIVYFWRRNPPEIPLNLPSNTPEITLISATNTSENTHPPLVVVLSPTETITLPPTITPTDTDTPTLTITPTYTATPTPTLTPIPPLFTDSFENGLSSEWSVLTGDPLLIDGHLTANAPVWLEVGDPAWTNIKIEYDVNLDYYADCHDGPFPGGFANYSMMLGLRYQDNDNMVGLKTGQCGFFWFVVRGGNWEQIPGKGPGPGYSTWKKITILIEGNKFTAFFDGIKSTSFVSDDYPTGKIGIRVGQDSSIDNFTVSSLP